MPSLLRADKRRFIIRAQRTRCTITTERAHRAEAIPAPPLDLQASDRTPNRRAGSRWWVGQALNPFRSAILEESHNSNPSPLRERLTLVCPAHDQGVD